MSRSTLIVAVNGTFGFFGFAGFAGFFGFGLAIGFGVATGFFFFGVNDVGFAVVFLVEFFLTSAFSCVNLCTGGVSPCYGKKNFEP